MKYFLLVLLAAISFTAQSAEIPIRRNFVTTNTFMNAPSDGWIAIWNNTAKKWSNGVNVASAANAINSMNGIGTNTSFYGTHVINGPSTNLGANPYVTSQDSGGGGGGFSAIGGGTAMFITTALLGLAATNSAEGIFYLWGGTDGSKVTAEFAPTGAVFYGHVGIATNLTVGKGVTLPSLTASRPLILNASGNVTNATGTPDGTKFLRDDGTLAVPSGAGGVGPTNANQFGASLTLTIASGALLTNLQVRGIDPLGLTASRALSLNASGDITNGTTTAAELEFVNGVTSAIQTQLGSKQAGTFLLTNFSAMGITNIVSANANTVITTNAGVLTLTTAGTGSPGGNSADVQFNQSGSFAGTNTLTYDRTNNILTAGSFYGSGTGVPIIKLQTMMSADNAFAITVATNRTATTTNIFDFTSVAVGDDVRAHTSSAGQIVWTNASSKILTNLVGMSFDYGLLYAATNTVAGTNIAINFSPNNTNHLDIYTTNWWCQWTNISGLAQGSLANKTIRITPSAPGQNLTNVWPVGKQHGIYQWNTNANSPIWTVLTNAKTYVLSLTAYGTNIHASMSLWEP